MEYGLTLTAHFSFVLFMVILSVCVMFKLNNDVKTARRESERKLPSLYTEYATYMYDSIDRFLHNISFYFLWYLVCMICLGIIWPYFTAVVGFIVTLIMTLHCKGFHNGVEGSLSALTERALARIRIEDLNKMKKNEDLLRLTLEQQQQQYALRGLRARVGSFLEA